MTEESERFNAAIAGRPDIMGTRTSLTVYTGMTGMTENAFINVKNRHHTIDAVVDLNNATTNGVITRTGGCIWRMDLVFQKRESAL